MISQNVYVRFDTFNTRDEVLDFVYDEKELNSNLILLAKDLNPCTSILFKYIKSSLLFLSEIQNCFISCLLLC